MSTADYQRAWRARHGARTGKRGPAPVQPCGTLAAFRRHQRHGEAIDDACRQAYNESQRAAYARRKGRTQ